MNCRRAAHRPAVGSNDDSSSGAKTQIIYTLGSRFSSDVVRMVVSVCTVHYTRPPLSSGGYSVAVVSNLMSVCMLSLVNLVGGLDSSVAGL